MAMRPTRIAQRIQAIAHYGAESGGTSRQALSDSEREACALIETWMREAGLTVYYDGVGNLHGRVNADDPRTVVTGSHIDTVIHGGNYDGVVGIVAGLEAVHALLAEKGSRTLKRSIEVIAFVGEEASRWPIPFLGSSALVNPGFRESLDTVRDAEGRSVAEELVHWGGGTPLTARWLNPATIEAFLEVHIEQGPVLEEKGLPIGIVSTIAGPLFELVRIEGTANHAGATPMARRHDALAAAAGLVRHVQHYARQSHGALVGTVGRIEAYPGSINIIPSQVDLSIDFRGLDPDWIEGARQSLVAEMGRMETNDGVVMTIAHEVLTPPTPTDAGLRTIIEAQAVRREIPHMVLPSWAGHDAMKFAPLAPTGMIFVRSTAGRSHCPEEQSSSMDIAMGSQLLRDTIASLAY